jgi:hypothetical protein
MITPFVNDEAATAQQVSAPAERPRVRSPGGVSETRSS